jgi:hypothetical protein
MKHFFPVVAAGVLGVLTSGAHGEELRNMTLGNARPPCAHRVRAGDTVRARVRLAALVGDMGRKTSVASCRYVFCLHAHAQALIAVVPMAVGILWFR